MTVLFVIAKKTRKKKKKYPLTEEQIILYPYTGTLLVNKKEQTVYWLFPITRLNFKYTE